MISFFPIIISVLLSGSISLDQVAQDKTIADRISEFRSLSKSEANVEKRVQLVRELNKTQNPRILDVLIERLAGC